MISKEKLPTSSTCHNHPIHNWFSFVAGYSPEYVENVIFDFQCKNNHRPQLIYDPFAGCGTTGVVANKYGINSIGVERNPFFYRIGYTKVHSKSALEHLGSIYDDFNKLLSTCLCDLTIIDSLSISAKGYLCKLFSEKALAQLLQLRNCVRNYTGFKYFMGFTFLSKAMEFVTSAKTDGIYRVPTSLKRGISVECAIEKTYQIFIDGYDEIEEFATMEYDSSIEYSLEKDSCDLVIFSPPYLNNFDFAEMTRMQLYFWEDASSWSEISEKHRNHMLVNTTTALKLVRSDDIQRELRDTLPAAVLEEIDPIIHTLKEIRRENSKKKSYDLIIYPYLSQMQRVLQQCYYGMRVNGEIHIVVSDASFYGVHIDTQEYLGMILESIGFNGVRCDRMRNRGDRWALEKRKDSGKQLGEYEVIAIKREDRGEDII